MRNLESIIAAVFLISPMAVNAELFDRGNGLIYDDELDVTWVQVADLAAGSSFDDGGGTFGDPLTDGLLTWASASAFVDGLSYAGFDDWRLPTMDANGDATVVNCAFATQADCLDNELGYLYYYSLGGTGGPLTGDTSPFTGVLFRYWGSNQVAPSSAWTFDFVGGIQGPVDTNGDALGNPAGAWAVRAGDVAGEATWVVTGTLSSVDTTGGFITEFPNAAVGTPFALTWTFDAASAPTLTTAGDAGIRYRYGDSLVSVELSVGGVEYGRIQQGFQSIDIWDDYTPVGSTDPAADGYNLIWGVNSPQGSFAQVAFVTRGSDDLTVFDGAGLPSEPPPGLTSLATQFVQFTDGSDAIIGTIDSVSVQAPPAASTYRGDAVFPTVQYSETTFPLDPTTGQQIQVTCQGTSAVSYSDMVVSVSPPTMEFTINSSRTGVTGTDPRFCVDSNSAFPFQVANVTATSTGVSGQNNAGTLFVDLLFNADNSELAGTVNSTDALAGQQIGQASLTLSSPTPILDGNGQLLGATDVNVNGALYTVTFTKGNCIDEFDGCDSPADFDFDNRADAEAATNALSDTVFVGAFDNDPTLQDGCDNFGVCGIFTPYGFAGQQPNVDLVVAQFLNYPNEVDDSVTGFQTRVLDIELNFAQTWARWQLQDPPPTPPVTVPADDCTATAGGCNPTGLHQFSLPDGFVPPPGATITQTVVSFDDTRADANGRCDGQAPQVLFDGDLTIPTYLCGSPEFKVLVTETNFDIPSGTVYNEVYPEEFVSNPIDCDIPIVGDPQLQSAFVWQPTVSADVIEGSAIALTNDCGSSRGRIRGFSYIVVGLHIDFGLNFDADPQAVTQAFADLTSTNLNTLVAAVINARPALNRRDFLRLYFTAYLAEWLHNRGRHHIARRAVQTFLSLTDRASFDTSVGFNHEGNLLSRADHIRFLLDEFITPFR